MFDDPYWIYATFSARYDDQTFFDCFSSKDLVHWQKHSRILDTKEIKWANRAMWAPSIIRKEGKYYFFFGANDIQNDQALGGIGVTVADRPEGPFKDHLGKPLIDRFHNGAQPIDQLAFRDADGKIYLICGGWRHCNIAQLNDDFTGFVPFEDGKTFKEITPDGYVEGPFMFIRNGKYYFMWSEGGWTGPNYSVAYAIYHRRPLGETDGNSRFTCVDRMTFDENRLIEPIEITPMIKIMRNRWRVSLLKGHLLFSSTATKMFRSVLSRRRLFLLWLEDFRCRAVVNFASVH